MTIKTSKVTGRPRGPNSVLQQLSDAGRLRKMPTKFGRPKWFARCENPKCKIYLPCTQKENRKYICLEHRGFQEIAGHQTSSKYWIRWKALIIGWKKTIVDNKAHHAPLTRCQEESCTKVIFFPPIQQKVDRYNLRCIKHYQNPKRLRPFEAAYRRMHRRHLDSLDKKRRIVSSVQLSYEEYLRVCLGKICWYCGIEHHRAKHITKNDRTALYSYLDRRNTLLPYTAENVVSCCGLCNRTKNAFLSEREMLLIGALRQGNREKVLQYADDFFTNIESEKEHLTKVIERYKARSGYGSGRPYRLKLDDDLPEK